VVAIHDPDGGGPTLDEQRTIVPFDNELQVAYMRQFPWHLHDVTLA
jgi:hypothetical protein